MGQFPARAFFRASAVVADTHKVLWYLADDPRLSVRASDALDRATADGEPINIPTICVVEATYLIEKNRIEAVAMARLDLALNQPGSAFGTAPLTSAAAFRPGDIPRSSVCTRDGKIRAAEIETIG